MGGGFKVTVVRVSSDVEKDSPMSWREAEERSGGEGAVVGAEVGAMVGSWALTGRGKEGSR